ncbi:MAG: DUF4476 domain-containing protein [Sphingobacteriales bacterium]|nr:MAG: DUF4476 domain-containing protein [Sphingobacteriales bacterium]
MNITRNISAVLLCCLLFIESVVAQTKESFSYIYIQSDIDVPFYVKYEDDMLPRYGKNYSIISELAPGTANLQILFQQHTLPPVKFTVLVPEDGFRGFLLTKKGDAFSLYDIHQKIYLQAGNSASDDQLPTFNKSQRIPEPAKTFVQPEAPKPAPIVTPPPTEQPKPVKQAQVKEKAAEKPKTETVKSTPTPPPTPVPTPKGDPPVTKPVGSAPGVPVTPPANNTGNSAPAKDPRFLDNIALENERTAGSTISKPRNRIIVVNSDCPEPIAESEFIELEQKIAERFGDDRLRYVLGRMDNCYSTDQMRTLARAMSSDAERYTLLKKAYSRVTDQSVFHLLEREFTEPEWKEYFRALLKK